MVYANSAYGGASYASTSDITTSNSGPEEIYINSQRVLKTPIDSQRILTVPIDSQRALKAPINSEI